MSHLGRPDGRKNEKYSLKPIVRELEELLGQSVIFTHDCVGKDVEETVNKANGGQVILLENLRFHAEEEGSCKDAGGKKIYAHKFQVEEFRKGLTALGDIYISRFSLVRDLYMRADELQMMLSAPLTAHTAQWWAATYRKRRRDS